MSEPLQSTESPNLSASLEDYIEVIYHIVTEKQVARGKDISARLSVSGASVTEALRALSKRGLINYAPYEVVTMTEAGKEIAEDVIYRHESLKKFFIDVLAVDEALAEDAACKIEHTAPRQIIARMVKFTKFLALCPRGGKEMIEGFSSYCESGRLTGACNLCATQCPDPSYQQQIKNILP